MKKAKTKGFVKGVARVVRRMGTDLNKSAVGQASRGKRKRGYL